MKISAVILAGGESRRMGRDKAEIVFKDKRTIDIMAEKLRSFDEIFISADKTYVQTAVKIFPIYIKVRALPPAYCQPLRK